MKLHSPAFEKALRRGAKSAIRKSRDLKREFRRVRRQHPRHYSVVRLGRPVLSVVIAVWVWSVAKQTEHVASALAIITLTAFLSASYRARNLLDHLYAAPDLPALALLPISPEAIFRWEFQKFVRQAAFSLLDLIAAFGSLALSFQFDAARWAGVLLIAVLTWAGLVAGAALGAAYFPRVPFRLGGAMLVVLFWLTTVSDTFRDYFVNLLPACALGINLVLPLGWPVSLFHLLMPNPHWSWLYLLLPVGILIWSLKSSLARLRSYYEFQEQTVPPAPDIVPGSEWEEAVEQSVSEDALQAVGPTEMEEIVMSRQFLAEPPWHQRGWFERKLWNWLTDREKVLAEFAFPNGIEIRRPWKHIVITLVITCFLAGPLSLVFPTASIWLLGLGLFAGACQVLAQLGGARAFGLVQSSGISIPMYAAYGVGYRELARMLFKRVVVQIPLLVAYALAASLMLGYVARFPLAASLTFGIKAAGVFFAASFVITTFGFSSGTNDTHVRARTLVFICLMVSSAVAGLILGLAAFLWPKPMTSWVCWLVFLLNAYAFFRIYGYFYHKNYFDLMRMPQQQV